MGKTFNSILRGFTNGAMTTDTPAQTRGRAGIQTILSMTPEQRTAYRDRAHTALREGLTVFMSKDTVTAWKRILNAEVTTHLMRKVLAEIANGKLVLTAPGKQAKPAAIHTKPVIPMVLSVDQLSAGMPFSLKQAAKILNVTTNKLYFRCVTGRIHFEKDKSRYFIPATEVERLRVIGL